jgi:cytoskeleton protein RodZ
MAENQTHDFGAHLRQAREARGTTLKQIATATKISVHALEALERNDTSRLPGGIFTRAFVRSYAKEVGLDPDRTLQAFVARFPDEAAPEAVDDRLERGGYLPDALRPGHSPLSVLSLVVSVGLLVVFFLVFGRLFSKSPPTSTTTSAVATPNRPARPASSSRDAAGRPPSSGTLSQTAAPAVSGEARTEVPGQSPASAPPLPAGAGRGEPAPSATGGAAVADAGGPVNAALRMEIAATGPCWVSATMDGTRTFVRQLATGDRAELRADLAIVIRVGDAGSFTFTLNGAPGRSLGGHGAVVTERIDGTNYRTYLVR